MRKESEVKKIYIDRASEYIEIIYAIYRDNLRRRANNKL